MSKNILGIGVGLIAVVLIGGLVFMNNKDNSKSSSGSATNTSKSSTHEGEDAANGNHKESGGAAKAEQTDQVEIKNFDFTQKKITVKKGTKVTWTNQDKAKHDITPDVESPDFTGSELLAKGESYSFTFNKAGIYSYNCSPHPYMKAAVEVVE